MQTSLRRCAASLPRLSRCVSSTTKTGHPSSVLSQSRVRSKWPLALTSNGARTFNTRPFLQQEAAAQAAPEREGHRVPITEFQQLQDLGLVHRNVIQTITQDMGLSRMTDVQTATINEALSGVDLVGQAKTGTGKTLAFLMPIFQKIIAIDPSLAHRSFGRTSASDIRAIVISPTRELAEQIAVEAKRMAKNTGIIVQLAVGGTMKSSMLRQTQRQGCHILVATPGRLGDLLSDPSSGIDAPRLNMFVLDEADRLLDQGFWQDVQNIRHMLPEPGENNVQTLMFSATVPNEVVSAVRETLKPGFRFIKCVRDDEEPTHERVPQNVVRVAGMQNFLPAVYELSVKEIQKRESAKADGETLPFKAIVYFNSTAMVELAKEVFSNLQRGRGSVLSGTPIFDLHSKLSQAHRTSASNAFRRASSAILLSSDVTSRGMDFPNVTHVLQVGVPPSTENYVHRIGRTARAGKEGTGYLFIHPLEEHMARSRLRNLPLKPNTELESATVDMTSTGDVPQRVATILQDVNEAHSRASRAAMSNAYRSLVGIHQYVDNKQALIDSMNALARYGWGLNSPPELSRVLVGKLGLGRVQGINVGDDSSRRDNSTFGGRYGARDGGKFGAGFGGERDAFGARDAFGGRDGYGQRGRSGKGPARW